MSERKPRLEWDDILDDDSLEIVIGIVRLQVFESGDRWGWNLMFDPEFYDSDTELAIVRDLCPTLEAAQVDCEDAFAAWALPIVEAYAKVTAPEPKESDDAKA